MQILLLNIYILDLKLMQSRQDLVVWSFHMRPLLRMTQFYTKKKEKNDIILKLCTLNLNASIQRILPLNKIIIIIIKSTKLWYCLVGSKQECLSSSAPPYTVYVHNQSSLPSSSSSFLSINIESFPSLPKYIFLNFMNITYYNNPNHCLLIISPSFLSI